MKVLMSVCGVAVLCAIRVSAIPTQSGQGTGENALKTAYDQMYTNFLSFTNSFSEVTGIDEKKLEGVVNWMRNGVQKLGESTREFRADMEKYSDNLKKDVYKSFDRYLEQLDHCIKELQDPDVKSRFHKVQETYFQSLKRMADEVADLAKTMQLPGADKASTAYAKEMIEHVQKTQKVMGEIFQDGIQKFDNAAQKFHS